ncbi:mucin-2-like [Chironomus tepperi]|uniref:mucin-2-like n=1 Tax=Chironomus tepperi TaxID=113505 RepID=UPI00391FA198
MKEILIATLLLGCLITVSSAQLGLFEFHDSYGRCWRCSPGSSCVRCSTVIVPFVSGPPGEWDRTCSQPSAAICAANPGVKFPHVDIGFYWVCAEEGIIIEAPCFCDHVFDMREQVCVKIEDLRTIACNTYANSEPHDCATEGDRPPPSTLEPGEPTSDPGVSVPTAPVETTPGTTPAFPTIPTAPNDPDATPTPAPPTPVPTPAPPTEAPPTPAPPTDPPVTLPTVTTEIGGPGATQPGNNTTVGWNTTPAPCVCVVWWPCWCNPCWNMPCHSCNGCVGMMG